MSPEEIRDDVIDCPGAVLEAEGVPDLELAEKLADALELADLMPQAVTE